MTASTPLVSVVIPTYNRAGDLRRALRSVRAQTYGNWEALVVDNHSIDDTDQAVAELNDPRIKLFKIHNDGVIAASRNVGIANAGGEYIAFLDSDDWWTTDKLSEAVSALQAGAEVVYHDLYYATATDQQRFSKHTRSRHLTAPAAQDLIRNGNTLGTSSVVVKKALLDHIGGLREDRDLVTWEDYDAWIRLAQQTERLVFIDQRLGYCWRGGGNLLISSRVLKNIEAFEKRYGSGIECHWIHYTRGRCHYLLGDYAAATPCFVRCLSKPLSAGTKLRALVLICVCAMRRILGGGTGPAVSSSPAK